MAQTSDPSDFTPERLALKAATRRAIDALGGSEAASKFTRVKSYVLERYGDDETCLFVPGDVALDLDFAVGTPLIVGAIAGLQGYELRLRGPVPTHPNPRCFADLMPLMAETSGRVFGAFFRTEALAETAPLESRDSKQDLMRELAALQKLTEEVIAALDKGRILRADCPNV